MRYGVPYEYVAKKTGIDCKRTLEDLLEDELTDLEFELWRTKGITQ